METTQPKRPLTREEFEQDMKTQSECYETLKQYNDFEDYAEYFHFDFITYEQYLERYEKYHQTEQTEQPIENEKNNIVINSIE